MAPAVSPVVLIGAFCLALTGVNLSFMVVAALLPTLIEAWSLSEIEAGWLGGIFFAGYVATVPVLSSLADRIDPRRIYLGSALIGMAASFGFAVLADGFWSALFWRFLAGVGLAGTYMPGLKAMSDNVPEAMRSRASGYYASVFAIGSALSFIVGGEAAAGWGWRWAFVVAGLGFGLAFLLIFAVLPRRAPDARTAPDSFDFRPVFANRSVMAYVLANFGGLFESVGLRTWLVPYLVFLLNRPGEQPALLSPTTIAAGIAFIGVAGAVAISELGERFGIRAVLIGTSIVSFAVAIATGAAVGLDYWAVVALLIACAVLNYGRTGPTTTGALLNADPKLQGTTMGIFAFIGFAGALVGPVAFGTALEAAGGRDDPAAWIWGFAAVAMGAVLTAGAVAALARGRGEDRSK